MIDTWFADGGDAPIGAHCRAGGGPDSSRADHGRGAESVEAGSGRSVRLDRSAQRRAWLLHRQRRHHQPYRVRVRPPSFLNLQALEKMAKGSLVADVVAIIGTIDIVLGEVEPLERPGVSCPPIPYPY